MAHLKFRAAQRRKGRESKFKALLAPASNYFCIAFLGLILARARISPRKAMQK